ncbi:MAG TPA: tRNA (adenosine(37)-N6)-threonylcarbamoyltransferase complex ATPase subunit type 1 TsaE [Longimicrobiales bacterium]|nr:tRNA (adenosine(37)-N6)-threonylcarbamoyltransferase complex ATPase subunit type 1 TsaE [Longimicrobiales bacterium]
MILGEAELEAWGEHIGATVTTPVFIALSGDLGAGKSVLARAIARGAGVTATMPSPTFNLVFRYDGTRATVAHLDLYRLEHEQDVWELGWRELGDGNEIVLVEWPERAASLLPPDRWDIRIDVATSDTRAVTLSVRGNAPQVPEAVA